MKTLLFSLLTLMLMQPPLHAQQNQSDKLSRDIFIMEGILERMLYPGGGPIGLNKPEGTYLPGYGVVFKVPASGGFTAFERISDPGQIKSIEIKKGKGDASEVRVDMKEVVESTSTVIGGNVRVGNITPPIGMTKEEKISLAADFLKDYAGIMGLSKNEKVALQFAGQSMRFVFVVDGTTTSESSNQDEFMVSIPFAEIQNGAASSMAKETFVKKLTIGNLSKGEKDIEIFANILQTALRDSDRGVNLQGDISHGLLEGFGLMFNGTLGQGMRVLRGAAATRVRGTGNTTVERSFFAGTNRDSVEREFFAFTEVSREDLMKAEQERSAKAKADLEKLENEIKQVFLDYGATLRSIDSKQTILLTLRITSPAVHLMNNSGTGVHKLEISVKKSVIEDYTNRKINKDKALAAIHVKRS